MITMQDLAPLEELERLRAEFLGMVSHELRAPLTSIKGSASTVLGASPALDPAEMIQFFRIMMDSVPELADLAVIFISGHGRDETIARALESGAADYIVKPFSPTVVCQFTTR